jgi:hypothetical protein
MQAPTASALCSRIVQFRWGEHAGLASVLIGIESVTVAVSISIKRTSRRSPVMRTAFISRTTDINFIGIACFRFKVVTRVVDRSTRTASISCRELAETVHSVHTKGICARIERSSGCGAIVQWCGPAFINGCCVIVMHREAFVHVKVTILIEVAGERPPPPNFLCTNCHSRILRSNELVRTNHG